MIISKKKFRKFIKFLDFKRPKIKKIIIKAFLVIFVICALILAWVSKDLPTPGRIKARRAAEATQIFDRRGELLYSVYGDQQRISIKFDQMPDSIKKATLAIEDKNFYRHHGIDFRGILRAFIYNMTHKDSIQGGSTITQQYVKNALLTPRRTMIRKIKEAILSLELEAMFSKNQILEMYLNEIPYGSNAYGIQAASKMFFGKDAKDLTLAEAATLASLPRAPTYYSPYGGHTDELMERKDYVLDRMVSLKFISKDDASRAKEEKINFIPRRENIKAPHFVMYTKEVLAEKYGDRMVEEGGLKVTTTLDPDKQKIAEEVITAAAAKNLRAYGATNAALVAIDPKNGEILAMVGSVDYFDMENDGNVNVSVSKRQPGSSFKPVVYATAFKGKWSPASTLFDVKTDFGGGYSPNNYDGSTRGPVSIRSALANSLNIPAVKILYLAGVEASIATAKDLGITTLTEPERYGLSLVLGGGEIKLLEETGAFAVFAAEGQKFDVSPILKVEDNRGKVLEDNSKKKSKQVLDPQIAYQISSILSDNVARTPVFGARSALYFPDRTVAVKTGTTDDFRDAWTIGYTPSLAAGIWVGNNNNAPMAGHAAAAMAAAPIWHSFMEKALANTPNEDFKQPAGIQRVTVDALTGLLPGKSSPLGTRTDIFASWQIPKERADIYNTVKINKLDGKLATDECPPSLIQEKTFANVHSEVPSNPNWEMPVRSWAAAAGLGSVAPTEKSPLCSAQNRPSIQIISPTDGATVSGDTNISVKVSAPLGVVRVEYFIDNISIGVTTHAPYSISYNMNNLSSGMHQIKTRVVDAGDFTGEDSISVNVIPDKNPPSNISWGSPPIIAGNHRITLYWTNPLDPDLSRVKIYRSTSSSSLGFLYTTLSAKSGQADSITITGLINGQTYYFTLKSVDAAGNESSGATISATPG